MILANRRERAAIGKGFGLSRSNPDAESKEDRQAIRITRGWAIDVLQEVRAIGKVDEAG
ncbi:hypothetical protein [Bradyrhizobium sp. LB11.1]|uniref:hypothetical protein n=1 Tax=Bradyrhizobium sp. LB11.1 TaxID=3156326 RepID=UPI0033994C86